MVIDVIALDETHLDKMGIYRLNIGSKYYIGATQNTTVRMLGHAQKLNAWFFERKYGKNSQTKICDYLLSNKWITHIYIELLEEVEYEECLVDAEQKWFDACFGDSNCLNFKMQSYRKVGDIEVRPRTFDQ